MPRNGKAQGSVSDEKNVDFVNENNEARRAARRLDKRHGFLAQIQNIQHSRDDYEQEYQQKRKERMIVAQENEAKEREIIMAREREGKERKMKESEEKERKLKEREDVEQRTKMQSSTKKDQLTRADLVSYWGHEGFAEQQKREKLRPRRLSNSTRDIDSPRLSKDSGDSLWDTRSEQTTSSLDDEFVVRKPSKLEMYVPPRRAVVTMESSPITKPVQYPVEKCMKGRGENKYGQRSVSRDRKSAKRIPSINDVKQNDFIQTSPNTNVSHSSGKEQSSIKEIRRDESAKNPPKPDKHSAVLKATKNVQQAAEAPKVIDLSRRHSRVESGDESNRSTDNAESCAYIRAEHIQQPSSKDLTCGRDERHSRPLYCGECVPRSPCCKVYDKVHNHYCVEKARESQFHEHSHRCKCTRVALQDRHCRAEDKGCNHSLGYMRDTQCDFSRTAKCNSLCHRSDHKHYDLSIEPSCLCHQFGSPTDGRKGSLSPVRSVDNQAENQVTKEKKKAVKKKKKKTEEAVLIMSIELGGEIKKLRYYESETVLDSALAFCKKHNFGGENQKAFAGALAEHLRRHLNESPEA